jgi:hypothetical protein
MDEPHTHWTGRKSHLHDRFGPVYLICHKGNQISGCPQQRVEEYNSMEHGRNF